MSLGFPLADVTANEISPVVTAMEGRNIKLVITVLIIIICYRLSSW